MSRPQVVAHRGASGYRPEHTIAAYELAVKLGADALEIDVVLTIDGVAVCRHEHQIDGTTNVAEVASYADRRCTRQVPGRSQATGWFTEDFTLDELATLRARERMPKTRPDSAAYDLDLPVPTLTEVLALVNRVRRERRLPLLIELKHSRYFASLGHDIGAITLAELAAAGLDDADADVTLESFEPTALQALRPQTPLQLMQLLEEPLKRPADLFELGDPRTFGDLVQPSELQLIAAYADSLGVHTSLILPTTPLIATSHDLGLTVSAFTLRAENRFLPAPWRSGAGPDALGDLAGFAQALAAEGADGLMTDHPDLVLTALARLGPV